MNGLGRRQHFIVKVVLQDNDWQGVVEIPAEFASSSQSSLQVSRCTFLKIVKKDDEHAVLVDRPLLSPKNQRGS